MSNQRKAYAIRATKTGTPIVIERITMPNDNPTLVTIRGRRWYVIAERLPRSNVGLHIIVCASRIDNDLSDEALIQIQQFERDINRSKKSAWREARHHKGASMRQYLTRRAIKFMGLL